MPTGIILKILSEFAYVFYEEKIYECKAIGKLRHTKQTPITGDNVEFNILDENNFKGQVLQLLPRKNELYRPRIANIDQVVIITAVREPVLNTFTLNKYLAFIEYLNIKPVLAFTKVDLLKENDATYALLSEYKNLGYETYLINNMIETDAEWNAFLQSLLDKVSVFTGQTGAGKSTTLNHIIPDLFEPTQEISKALNRGKHTTTKNELFHYFGGLIGDTPGFSSFEFKDFDKYQLAHSFKMFEEHLNACKFNDCLHLPETPGCKILQLVHNHQIPNFIYDDYVKMQREMSEKEYRRKK
ncbi:ribosome biogenesis GTPase [Spiroplasma clarkii]|uniref:Small ribosomal subunit biogenesis GTPase RsgA n=2 Tax=Spiroplasma clarkii TaxID=2139 RepID=A0A2K8KKB2_9MOLU|nr:ribosome biogenesis GTPase [Spiroplasma clarkii]